MTVTNTGLLEPPQLAVDAWVRRSGSPGRWRYVLSNGSLQCNRSAYGLYSGWSGGMGFYVSGTSEYAISPEVSPAIVWDGGWHHIIGSYDGDRVRLWIDGSQVGAGTPATGPIVYSRQRRHLHRHLPRLVRPRLQRRDRRRHGVGRPSRRGDDPAP